MSYTWQDLMALDQMGRKRAARKRQAENNEAAAILALTLNGGRVDPSDRFNAVMDELRRLEAERRERGEEE